MKHLKKSFAVVMILIMTIFVFTGCGAGGSANEKSLEGTWKCSALDMGSGDILSQLGSSYSESILFYALDDGSCLLDMAGQQLPMEWKWMKDNNDYKLTITLAGFAEANGMTEEEMKAQLQGSNESDLQTEQSYKAEIKDGKIIMNMASFYEDSKDNEGSSADSSYKMEFTFDRTGDAPKSLDEVKVPAAAATAPADTEEGASGE